MGKRQGLGQFMFHFIMTFITGGVWLVGLLIWYVLRNKN